MNLCPGCGQRYTPGADPSHFATCPAAVFQFDPDPKPKAKPKNYGWKFQCSVPGCPNKVNSKHYCERHHAQYMRRWRKGLRGAIILDTERQDEL